MDDSLATYILIYCDGIAIRRFCSEYKGKAAEWRVVWTFLFLLVLTGTLVPPAAGQSEHETENIQAEEHQNITLTWIYMVPPDKPPYLLTIDLMTVNPLTRIYLYDSKMEAEPYTHKSYKGRMWCDPRLAREGRIECLLKDLRLSDTGTYQVVVVTDGSQTVFKKYELSVTASMFEAQAKSSEPAGRGRIGLYVSLVLWFLVLVCLCVFWSKRVYVSAK